MIYPHARPKCLGLCLVMRKMVYELLRYLPGVPGHSQRQFLDVQSQSVLDLNCNRNGNPNGQNLLYHQPRDLMHAACLLTMANEIQTSSAPALWISKPLIIKRKDTTRPASRVKTKTTVLSMVCAIPAGEGAIRKKRRV